MGAPILAAREVHAPKPNSAGDYRILAHPQHLADPLGPDPPWMFIPTDHLAVGDVALWFGEMWTLVDMDFGLSWALHVREGSHDLPLFESVD